LKTESQYVYTFTKYTLLNVLTFDLSTILLTQAQVVFTY